MSPLYLYPYTYRCSPDDLCNFQCGNQIYLFNNSSKSNIAAQCCVWFFFFTIRRSKCHIWICAKKSVHYTVAFFDRFVNCIDGGNVCISFLLNLMWTMNLMWTLQWRSLIILSKQPPFLSFVRLNSKIYPSVCRPSKTAHFC